MIPDLAKAWGGPAGEGVLRAAAADFEVEEVLGFDPGGGGEHLWLWIEKRNANSEDVAAELARRCGVKRRAVGYSGRKDRNAVTRQWFSVHLPGADDPTLEGDGDANWTVLHSVRHGRKLRTGTHRANAFVIRVREFTGDRSVVDERAGAVRDAGFPNYFGPQRFGRNGENLRRARAALAAGGRRRVPGIQLSAARSALFNRVLDARVRDGSWNRALVDDAMMLAGTHSVFRCRGDEPDLEERLATHDIDPTGPMWGRGEAAAGPAASERERRWLADEQDLREALERLGVSHSRRALRVWPDAFEWEAVDDTLVLRFTLPAGAFATSLLREIVTTREERRTPA